MLEHVQHLDLAAEDCRTLFGWNVYPDPVTHGLRSDQLRLLPHADTDVISLLFQRPGVRLEGGTNAAQLHALEQLLPGKGPRHNLLEWAAWIKIAAHANAWLLMMPAVA